MTDITFYSGINAPTLTAVSVTATNVSTSMDIRFRTGSQTRWAVGKNPTVESGSNAGSNFEIQAFADAGSFLSTPFSINRSTGNVTLSAQLLFGADTNLFRNGVDELKTDDKFLAALGIGVGNSAAATTLGAVVRKMEVFDAAGASLGFVPIYDTIT